MKKALSQKTEGFPCSGGQTRTDDLRVMSPTSYQLLHPAIYSNAPERAIAAANIMVVWRNGKKNRNNSLLLL